jgi:hypothetical protein
MPRNGCHFIAGKRLGVQQHIGLRQINTATRGGGFSRRELRYRTGTVCGQGQRERTHPDVESRCVVACPLTQLSAGVPMLSCCCCVHTLCDEVRGVVYRGRGGRGV